jgi:hypothetical protein
MWAIRENIHGSYSCTSVGVNANRRLKTYSSAVSDFIELQRDGIYLLVNKCFHSETDSSDSAEMYLPWKRLSTPACSTSVPFARLPFFYVLVSCIYISLFYCEARVGLDDFFVKLKFQLQVFENTAFNLELIIWMLLCLAPVEKSTGTVSFVPLSRTPFLSSRYPTRSLVSSLFSSAFLSHHFQMRTTTKTYQLSYILEVFLNAV